VLLNTAALTEYLANARVLKDEGAVISNITDILYIGQLSIKWFRAPYCYPMIRRISDK
jgi:hypothetical protein